MNEENNVVENSETVVPTEEQIPTTQDPIPVSTDSEIPTTQESITVPINSEPVHESYSARSTNVQVGESTDEDPLGLKDERYTADQIAEQPEIIKVIDKKPVNKKLIIAIIAIVLVVVIGIVLVLFVFNKPQKKQTTSKVEKRQVSNDSLFVKTIKESLQSGEFIKEMNKGLEANGLTVENVLLVNMDIDSDGDQEIVAYAEKEDKKVLISLEVDEAVMYDDSYPVDSKDSLGYAYASERRSNYWYTEYQKNYTIIAPAKKIIKEEDFLKDFFAITKTYDEKPIFANSIEYHMDKSLDAEKLEKMAITNKDLLENNKMDQYTIEKAYDKYVTEKEEEEKKKKEEEEERAKQEEEAKKLAGTLKVGNSSFRFGTYNVYTKDGALDGTLIIYGDSTCIHKGVACTYRVTEVRGKDDNLVTGLALSTGQNYIPGTEEGKFTNSEESVSIEYAS